MDFPYVAFTGACTFGLDEKGICREIAGTGSATEADLAIARRCLGAQYVASLDGEAEGFLAQLPKPGTRLLFARTEADGRIVLVRSGPLSLFITRQDDDEPVAESTIDTSAPSATSFEEEATAPFSRARRADGANGGLEIQPVTRRVPPPADSEPVTCRVMAAPATVRGFPPPLATPQSA